MQRLYNNQMASMPDLSRWDSGWQGSPFLTYTTLILLAV